MNKLKLQLLGRPQVWLGEELVTAFSSDKVVALLAYLVAVGEPVSRTAVEGLLWGESDRERAQTSLRTAVYNLNKLLPDRILTSRKTIQFDPTLPFTTDFLELEKRLAQGELDTAVALYQGDFLTGTYFDDAPEFENWLLRRRESLRQQTITALEQLIPQTRDLQAATQYCRQLITLEPWHEAAHRRLMRLLTQQGNLTSALKLYDSLVTTLHDELGVAPMPETARLAKRLRTRQARVQMHNLPQPLTPQFGRTAELKRLADLLHDPRIRLISLTGLGGSGKTTLALSAARLHEAEFLEGVCFVPLADLPADSTAVFIANHILHHLANLQIIPADREPTESAVSHLVQAVQDIDLLLLLDNLEHLQQTAIPLITHLVQESQLTLLTTSRQRLNLSFETAIPVGGLAYPPQPIPADWRDYPAVQLIAEAATRRWPDFALTEADSEPLQQICARLAGLPLALELAAVCLADESPTAVVEALAVTLDHLQPEEATTDRPERQRSLRAIFSYTWQSLPPPLQPILPQLAFFPGPFGREAATAVAGATGNQLSQLINYALLQRLDWESYELHPLIRAYATELMPATGAQSHMAVAGRFVTHFAQYAQTLMAAMGREQGKAWPALLGAELNLRLAWVWAWRLGDPAPLDPLAEALGFLYVERGAFQEGLALWDTAVGGQSGWPGDWPPLIMARLRLAYTRFLFYTHQHGRARTELETLLPTLRQAGTPSEIALALRGLSLTSDDSDEVIRFEAESLALFRQAGDAWQVARSLINLAVTEGHRAAYGRAKERHDEAIALLRGLGDQLELARALEYRGEIARLEGDYSLALALMGESLALRRQSADQDGLWRVLFNLGLTHVQVGDAAQARALFLERQNLVSEARQGRDRAVREGWACLGLAQVALLAGDLPEARAWLTQAESGGGGVAEGTLAHLYLPELAAFVQLGWGDVAWLAGDTAVAGTHYEASWRQFVALEQVARAWGARARWGWALARAGQGEAARGHWRALIRGAVAKGLRPVLLTAVGGLAWLDGNTAVVRFIHDHPATDAWTRQALRCEK